jgi:hypothetical protein
MTEPASTVTLLARMFANPRPLVRHLPAGIRTLADQRRSRRKPQMVRHAQDGSTSDAQGSGIGQQHAIEGVWPICRDVHAFTMMS